jgi:hypothetical protein
MLLTPKLQGGSLLAAVKTNARRFAANVRPIIDEIMRAGATSHNAIAAKLNERNVKTARA